jgi:hypothetical protein
MISFSMRIGGSALPLRFTIEATRVFQLASWLPK